MLDWFLCTYKSVYNEQPQDRKKRLFDRGTRRTSEI